MKKVLRYGLLGLLLGTAGACKKDADAPAQSCAPDSPVVKTVAEAQGIVRLDQATQQYVISVAQPTTIDVVAVGVVCSALPASLQADGTRVIVSGAYKEYKPQPTGLPVGYTYYYLELTQVRAQ